MPANSVRPADDFFDLRRKALPQQLQDRIDCISAEEKIASLDSAGVRESRVKP